MQKKLKQYIESHNVELHEASIPVKKVKGLYFGGTIVIDNSVKTAAEYDSILAEELGHHATTTGNILDQSDLGNQKQEKRARKWAHDKLIPLCHLIDCYYAGCRNRYETAEHLGVTEEFLSEALACYLEIHGPFVVSNDHLIYFDPPGIMKLL